MAEKCLYKNEHIRKYYSRFLYVPLLQCIVEVELFVTVVVGVVVVANAVAEADDAVDQRLNGSYCSHDLCQLLFVHYSIIYGSHINRNRRHTQMIYYYYCNNP